MSIYVGGAYRFVVLGREPSIEVTKQDARLVFGCALIHEGVEVANDVCSELVLSGGDICAYEHYSM